MPKVPEKKNQGQEKCYAHRHMRPVDFAVYQYALIVSHHSGVFYADTRAMAADFGKHGVSRSSMQQAVNRLEEDGWFERLDKGKRLKRSKRTGLFLSIRFQVLTHEEYSALYPRRCRFPSDKPGPDFSPGDAWDNVWDNAPGPDFDFTGTEKGIPPGPDSGPKVSKELRLSKENIEPFIANVSGAKSAPYMRGSQTVEFAKLFDPDITHKFPAARIDDLYDFVQSIRADFPEYRGDFDALAVTVIQHTFHKTKKLPDAGTLAAAIREYFNGPRRVYG